MENTKKQLKGVSSILPAANNDIYGHYVEDKLLNGIMIKLKSCSGTSDVLSLNRYKLYNSITIGIGVYLDSGLNWETLIKNADIAMYMAKRRKLYYGTNTLTVGC